MNIEISKIQEAFSAIYSEDVPVAKEVKTAAETFLNSVVSQPHVCGQFWDLFLLLSREVVTNDDNDRLRELPRSIHEIRFWCLQTVSKNLDKQCEEESESLVRSLWTDYICDILPRLSVSVVSPASLTPATSKERLWVLNKALSLYIALIGRRYPASWSTPFSALIERISTLHSTNQEELVLDVSLLTTLMVLLDRDIISDDISARTEQERAVANRVKNGLRDGDIHLYLNLCARIFDGTLFGLRLSEENGATSNSPANMLSPTKPPTWYLQDIAAPALSSLASITRWTDLALLLSEQFRFLSVYSTVIAKAAVYGPKCAGEAFAAFSSIITKKMNPQQKGLLIKEYFLVEFLLGAVERSGVMEVATSSAVETLQIRAAETLEVVVDELLDVLDSANKLSNNRTPPEFSDHIFEKLKDISLVCVKIFVLPKNYQCARILGASLFKIFKRIRRLGPLPFRESLVLCLRGCAGRVQYPAKVDWQETYNVSEEGALETLADDGSEASAFLICRRQALEVFWVCFSSAENLDGVAAEYLTFLDEMAVNGLATPTSEWSATEAAISLYAKSVDSVSMDGVKSHSSIASYLNTSLRRFNVWKTCMERGELVAPPIRLAFALGVGKLSALLQTARKVVHPQEDTSASSVEGLLALLTFLAGPSGLQSGDSSRVVKTSLRELIRASKNLDSYCNDKKKGVSEDTDFQKMTSVFGAIVNSLSVSGYFKLTPIPVEYFCVEGSNGQLRSKLRDLFALDEARTQYYQFLSDLPMANKLNRLTFGDQVSLFHLVGVVPLPAAMRQSCIIALLKSILEDHQNLLTQLNSAPQVTSDGYQLVVIEFVGRTLKCISHLLRAFQFTSRKEPQESPNRRLLDEISSLASFATQRFGSDPRVAECAILLWRRLHPMLNNQDNNTKHSSLT